MNQFNEYVKEAFAPKQSQKKREELLRAIVDKKCSFARYDPHLPLDSMIINEPNYPISPKYVKT